MIDANDSLTAPTSRSPRRSTSPKVTTPKRGSLAKGKPRPGIKVERVFSDAKRNPYDEIEWDNRTAEITDEGGNIIFKQEKEKLHFQSHASSDLNFSAKDLKNINISKKKHCFT